MEQSEYVSGSYPIQNIAGEVERLKAQDAALSDATNALLDAIGVSPGWRCLDLACGPQGVTRYLLDRVGPEGRVVGLDGDDRFLAVARGGSEANPSSFRETPMRLDCPSRPSTSCICAYWRAPPETPRGWSPRRRASSWRAFPTGAAIRSRIASIDCSGAPVSRTFNTAQCRSARAQDSWRDYLPSTILSMEKRITRDLGVPKDRLGRRRPEASCGSRHGVDLQYGRADLGPGSGRTGLVTGWPSAVGAQRRRRRDRCGRAADPRGPA